MCALRGGSGPKIASKMLIHQGAIGTSERGNFHHSHKRTHDAGLNTKARGGKRMRVKTAQSPLHTTYLKKFIYSAVRVYSTSVSFSCLCNTSAHLSLFLLLNKSLRASLKLSHLGATCPSRGAESVSYSFFVFLRAYSHEGESLIVSGSECYCGGRKCRALSAGQRQADRSGREWKGGRRAV